MSARPATSPGACTSRSCSRQSAGLGPFCGLALCQQHLASDIERVRERQSRLLERLQGVPELPDGAALLRAEQQSLEAEVQQVSDAFDEVQERLQQWKDKLVSRVQAACDLIAARLVDVTEAEDCSKEMSLASDAGDMRKVMELTVSMESWLDEASERSVEFNRARLELRKRQGREGLRSVGDVAAGVQQLQLTIARHLSGVMQRCWIGEASEEPGGPRQLCRPSGTVEGLENYPYCVTACSNTDGFVYDTTSGRVKRRRSISSADADDCTAPLPQPCIFVSFGNNCVDHLLVTSLGGATKARCHCRGLDWSQVITGLHCDSLRQLLYVAQPRSVTVTDLSGQLAPVQLADAAADSAATAGACCIAGLDGSSDKLFLLDSSEHRVLLLCKDSGELQSVVNLVDAAPASVVPEGSSHGFCGLAVLQQGSKLLLATRDGQLVKVCSIGGQLIDTRWPKFQGCLAVAADFGLTFVAESSRHAVAVVSGDGAAVLQTLDGNAGEGGGGSAGCLKLKFPCALALASSAARGSFLVVADRDNKRLLVFEVWSPGVRGSA